MVTVIIVEESVPLLQSAQSTRSLNVMFTHCEIVIKNDSPGGEQNSQLIMICYAKVFTHANCNYIKI